MASLLAPYNPWWSTPRGPWRSELPSFERPIVQRIRDDLRQPRQIISVTGPRRVGKTTALLQVVAHLLDEEGVPPRHVLYFSLDDPAVIASPQVQSTLFSRLVQHQGVGQHAGPAEHYFLLDEIQRLPYWEVHLKKHYDLSYSLRFIVSGSASSPIFRKSHETLSGRIHDNRLLPFSFREFAAFRLQANPAFGETLGRLPALREVLLTGQAERALRLLQDVDRELLPLRPQLDNSLLAFWQEGGYPELWTMADPVRRQAYVWENQVTKVLHQDLIQVTTLRKPENVARLALYLLSRPGAELNATSMAREAGVRRQLIEEHLPLLEFTDLIRLVRRFTPRPIRVRQGNVKCYVVDLALHNAATKTWTLDASDAPRLGTYAENTVANHLLAWPEPMVVAYFREKNEEVDFVATTGGFKHLPIEVKYRANVEGLEGMERFLQHHDCPMGIVVTKSGPPRLDGRVLHVPLQDFLLVT